MAEGWTHKQSFSAVDDLVKSWSLNEYNHHVRLLRDNAERGLTFLVIFSQPQPSVPVPPVVAHATFTVVAPSTEGGAPKITYVMETQRQALPSHLPIRKQWIDAAIRRKERVAGITRMFAQTGRLPAPVAFVPGQYKAGAALAETALDGLEDNEERMVEALGELGAAQDVAVRSAMETVEELEKMLVGVFNDGDQDGNGYLEPKEFFDLLETAGLDLDLAEKRTLLAMADANGDGCSSAHTPSSPTLTLALTLAPHSRSRPTRARAHR